MGSFSVEDDLRQSEAGGRSRIWECHLKGMLELPGICTAIGLTLRAEVNLKPTDHIWGCWIPWASPESVHPAA